MMQLQNMSCKHMVHMPAQAGELEHAALKHANICTCLHKSAHVPCRECLDYPHVCAFLYMLTRLTWSIGHFAL